MKPFQIDYSLYLVTEESIQIDKLLPMVEAAVSGGVSIVQLREKDTNGQHFYEKALILKKCLDKLSIPLIINDRIDIALAINAAGVHVGQTDLPIEAVKKIVPESMIVGLSVRTVEQAIIAERQGVDYLGVGSVYPTATKDDAQILSRGMLTAISQAVSIPTVAIGGINANNIRHIRDSGTDGFAVVSAITRADNPKAAAEILIQNAFHDKT